MKLVAELETRRRFSEVEELISELEKEEQLKHFKKLLVALDYDGTLVPFAPRPEQAVPGPRVLEVLNALAGRSDVVLAIVSGRTLPELEEFIPLHPVWLSALHGAVIRPPGKRPEWLIDPASIGLLRDLIKNISQRLFFESCLPGGFRLENKGLSLAIHFRDVPDEQAEDGLERLLRVVGPMVDDSLFELMPGAKVVEIRPLNVNKGQAVSLIADSNRDCFPVYLGDDVTDEDAFKALREKGFTVRVSSETRPTAARWQLMQTGDTLDFLENLAVVMDKKNNNHLASGGYTR